MNLLLIARQCGENSAIADAARSAGWSLASELAFDELGKVIDTVQADAAILAARRVDDEVLRAVKIINSRRPLPVVLYTDDSLQQSIHAAVAAGVSAYVADCTDINRLGSLLDVATARFAETQSLKKELFKAKATLAERGTVEKAKGIIMRQRQVSEDKAYQLLRKLAMDRNRRIGEVAGEVIAAAEILT